MVLSIRVLKVSHPVTLTLEEDGLRIDGDFNAAKACNVILFI